MASQLGWPTDVDPNSPGNVSLAAEFAGTFQSLLRPFEEVWTQSLRNQQQALLNQQRPTAATQQQSVPAAQTQASSSLPTQYGQHQMPSQPSLATQQQPQQQQQSHSLGAGQALAAQGQQQRPSNDPSLEQITDSRNVVAQLKSGIDRSRPKVNVINIPEDMKGRVAQFTQELVPLVKKVVEILPLYLAMSKDTDTTRKMLLLVRSFLCAL